MGFPRLPVSFLGRRDPGDRSVAPEKNIAPLIFSWLLDALIYSPTGSVLTLNRGACVRGNLLFLYQEDQSQ